MYFVLIFLYKTKEPSDREDVFCFSREALADKSGLGIPMVVAGVCLELAQRTTDPVTQEPPLFLAVPALCDEESKQTAKSLSHCSWEPCVVPFLPLNPFIIINTSSSGVLKSLPYKVIFFCWGVDRGFIE